MKEGGGGVRWREEDRGERRRGESNKREGKGTGPPATTLTEVNMEANTFPLYAHFLCGVW